MDSKTSNRRKPQPCSPREGLKGLFAVTQGIKSHGSTNVRTLESKDTNNHSPSPQTNIVCLLKHLSCRKWKVCTPVFLSKISKELDSVNIKLGFPKCKHHTQAWTASLDGFLCVWTGMNHFWEWHWHESLELAASSAPLVDVLPQPPRCHRLSKGFQCCGLAWDPHTTHRHLRILQSHWIPEGTSSYNILDGEGFMLLSQFQSSAGLHYQSSEKTVSALWTHHFFKLMEPVLWEQLSARSGLIAQKSNSQKSKLTLSFAGGGKWHELLHRSPCIENTTF